MGGTCKHCKHETGQSDDICILCWTVENVLLSGGADIVQRGVLAEAGLYTEREIAEYADMYGIETE